MNIGEPEKKSTGLPAEEPVPQKVPAIPEPVRVPELVPA